MTTPHTTREAWLTDASTTLCAWLADVGHPVRDVYRVSCGFPCKGAGAKAKAIGQAHDPSASAGKVAEVFVSPVLADPVRVLDVLTHELVHVAVGCKAGHKGPFKRAATAIGLEGKMTATHSGKVLTERLNALADSLGSYPHDALSLPERGSKGSRLLPVTCGCGIKARASATAAEQMIEAGWKCATCGLTIGIRDTDDEGETEGEGE